MVDKEDSVPSFIFSYSLENEKFVSNVPILFDFPDLMSLPFASLFLITLLGVQAETRKNIDVQDFFLL